MLRLVIGLLLFLGIHSVRMVAPGYRDNFITERGENAWKGIYSVISIIGFVVLVWGYGQARAAGIQLWFPPLWLTHVTALLMLPAMIFLVASQVPAGKIKARLKHPMVLSIKVWAVAHLLANGDLATMMLAGTFLGWAVWNRIVWKRRGDPVYAVTKVQYDVIAVLGGCAAYLLFIFWAHEWLFGVAPIVTSS